MMVLSNKSMNTIASTAPILQIHVRKITSIMYRNLFTRYPELLNMYNQSNHAQGLQQTAFSNMLLAIARNISQIDMFLPSIKKINHKHVSVGVKAEHYPLIKESLLDAMKEVLGRGTATDRFVSAWEEAYNVIAKIFIDLEENMYREVSTQPGGWDGFKRFKIIDKVEECNMITSFYLKPEDGSKVPLFKPGQYITLRLHLPGEKYLFNRQYSLSCAPGRGYFRISVKNEVDYEPNGKVSSYLHENKQIGDILDISVPRGTFYVDINESSPIALISGGIGITPFISILDTLVMKKSKRKVTLVHSARNESNHAFARESAEMITKLDNGAYYFGYEKPSHLLGNHDFSGYLNDGILKKFIDPNTKYYVCGPYLFMKKIINKLIKLGVSKSNINYDFFAPELPVQREKVLSI